MAVQNYSPGLVAGKHLLSIDDIAPADIDSIIQLSLHYWQTTRQSDTMAMGKKYSGKSIINLFTESSTRTQKSFEIAAKRLGMDVINFSVEGSSIKKGETILDTALTLDAMRPDILVVRNAEAGSAHLLALKIDCPVINAGDGAHEHPTQALLDAATITMKKGKVAGLTIAICGDILHSRVARSNILLLTKLGARVRVVAPLTLLPPAIHQLAPNLAVFTDMREGVRDCDIIMMLRLQQERMNGSFLPSPAEYYHFYGLDEEKLSCAKPAALVMHPGPMNRGVEIASSIADMMDRSLIRDQVEMGVAVRMAVIDRLLSPASDNAKGRYHDQ
ncbi:MAG: aspartate carbamoyltransferase catalytic subunit [Alphaproteobacteria bacterium]|nr:aspartate carbamoyltransferase catalytic subunit [Alphaproteobacteria bacterium]